MTQATTRTRVRTVKDEYEKGEFVEFHSDEFPGYFVRMLAVGGPDDPERRFYKHMVNIAYLEPGAKKVHTHEAENVLYILEGEGIYYLDWDKTVPVKAGDICIAASGEPHGFRNTGDRRLVYIAVEGPWDFSKRG